MKTYVVGTQQEYLSKGLLMRPQHMVLQRNKKNNTVDSRYLELAYLE